MRFDTLMAEIHRAEAEFDFELARCEDPYRLALLTQKFQIKMQSFSHEARMMVEELEGRA
jgi:hypothetical protein